MDTPKTASRREPRAPFAFEDELIRPGTARTIELRIARLPTGTWMTMPVVIMHGARPGPTIWVSGAVHGDELNGIAIVRRLAATLEARHLAGTVIAVPIVNVFGVTNGSRYLPDGRDLNRSFPGSRRGSLAARLAHLFFQRIAVRCDLGLDFHTGSGGRCNLPQLRCDLDDPDTLRYARAFAPPLVLDAKLRDGSLRAAAWNRGIRVLLYEAGEALRLDSDAVGLGVSGTLRVMKTMGMIAEAPATTFTPAIVRKSTWVRAGRSGFCLTGVELGQHVEASREVATIIDSTGKKEFSVRARFGGIVIGLLSTALVHRGDALLHIAHDAEPATTPVVKS